MECRLRFYGQEGGEPLSSANGFADAVKGDTVYELKFVSELRHEHFLQCAVYMAALDLPERYPVVRRVDNTAYEIEIPDRAAFLDAVTRTVTKGMIQKYHDHRAVQEMPWDVKNEPHIGKAEEYESGAEKKEKPGKKRKSWFPVLEVILLCRPPVFNLSKKKKLTRFMDYLDIFSENLRIL